ncbi:MAG: PKD domain-containing protein [Thermoplasmatota archaeon]
MKKIIRITSIFVIISLMIGGSMSALASGEGIWYQADEKGKTYDIKFVAHAGDGTYTKNNMTVSAIVESVTHFSDKQEIDVWVTANGACKERKEYYQDYDYYELYTTAGTRLAAKLGNNAPDVAQIDHDATWNYRGNMTDQDNDIGGTQDKDASDYVKLAALFGLEEAIDRTPYLGTAYHAATFYQEHFAKGGALETSEGGTGANAEASEIFKTREDHYWNNELPAGETEPYLYQAETHFTITIPDDPDTGESVGKEFNIEISAKNIMNSWQKLSGAGVILKDGARASLTITIKNGKLMNPSASIPVKELYTSDFTPQGEEAFVYPGINIDLGENFASDDAPFYDVRVYIPDKDNFENDKLLYTFEDLKSATDYMDKDIPTLYWEDWRDFDDGLDNGNDRVRVPVRRIEVEAKQEYGGWVQDIDASDMYWDMIFDSDDASVEAPSDAEVTDYGTYEYDFKVSNLGSRGDTYELSASNTAGWSMSTPDTVVVGRGEAEYVTVAIAVTDGEAFAGDSTEITLTANSIYTETTASDSMVLSFQPGEDYSVLKINDGDLYTKSRDVTLSEIPCDHPDMWMQFRNEDETIDWKLRSHTIDSGVYDDHSETEYMIHEQNAEQLKITIYSGDFASGDYLRVYNKDREMVAEYTDTWDKLSLKEPVVNGDTAYLVIEPNGDGYTGDGFLVSSFYAYTQWSPPEPYSSTKSWTLSSGDGSKTVWVQAWNDWKHQHGYGTILLDTNKPGLSNFQPSERVFTQTPDVSVDVQDATSGLNIDSIICHYRSAGGTWTETTDFSVIETGNNDDTSKHTITLNNLPFNQDSEINNQVSFEVEDIAGNIAVECFTVVIDTVTPPSISNFSPTGWTSTLEPECSVDVHDYGYGVETVRYRHSSNDGVSWSDWKTVSFSGETEPIRFTDIFQFSEQSETSNKIQFEAADMDENTCTETFTVKIDTTPPGDVSPYLINPIECKFKFEWVHASDALSGVEKYEWQLRNRDDNNKLLESGIDFTNNAYVTIHEGEINYRFRVRAIDEGGNTGDWGYVDFYHEHVIGTITGHVYNADYLGEPQENVDVDLLNAEGDLVSTCVSEKDGFFSVEYKGTGDYYFVVDLYTSGWKLLNQRKLPIRTIGKYTENLYVAYNYTTGTITGSIGQGSFDPATKDDNQLSVSSTDNDDKLIDGKVGVMVKTRPSSPITDYEGYSAQTDYYGDFELDVNILYTSENTKYRLCFVQEGYYPKYIDVTFYGSKTVDVGTISPLKEHPGCPYAGSWNGTDYGLGNSILPASESIIRDSLDVQDYFVLDSIVPVDEEYKIRINEFEGDTSHIDSFHLLEVAYESPGELVATSDGELFVYSNPVPPVSAETEGGEDIFHKIAYLDDTSFNGSIGDKVICNFGEVDTDVRLLINADKIAPPDVGVPRQQLFGPIEVEIYQEGDWTYVGDVHPRSEYSMEVLDLSPYHVKTENLIVRLTYEGYNPTDFVGIDSSPQPEFVTNKVTLNNAYSPVFGNVTEQLVKTDGRRFTLNDGQELILAFESQKVNPDNILLVSEGYYQHAYSILRGVSLGVEVGLSVSADGPINMTIYEDDMRIKGADSEDTFITFTYHPDRTYTIEFQSMINTLVNVEINGIAGSTVIPLWVDGDETMNLNHNLEKVSSTSYSDNEFTVPSSNPIVFDATGFSSLNSIGWKYFYWDFGDGYRIKTSWSTTTHIYDEPGVYDVSLITMYENNRTIKVERTVVVTTTPPTDVLDVWQEVDVTLSIAGRKDNTLTLLLHEDGEIIRKKEATQTGRNTNTVTQTIKVFEGRDYTMDLIYNATHVGSNPVFLSLNSQTGSHKIKQIFNTKDGFNQCIKYNITSELVQILSEDRLYHFSGENSYSLEGTIISHYWNFGDGNTAEGATVNHEYITQGVYKIRLTVVDDREIIAVKELLLIVP